MTQPDPNENVVQDQQVDNANQPGGTDDSSSQQQDNSNDLYAPYLEKFPESLHHIARDVFKEWDGNVTKRIQTVHSEYEPYKPIVENYEPDAVQQAIALAEAMERDPSAFMNALANAYGLNTQQQGQEFVQQDPVEPQGYDLDPSDPNAQRLLQHEQLLQTMAETMLREREERTNAEEFQRQEEEYANLMTELIEKHGEFDVTYVNTLLAQGVDPDIAVNHWKSQLETFAQKQLSPNNDAPVVMGAGGGMPSVQRDVENLSSQETRALVEQMLRQAAEQNGR